MERKKWRKILSELKNGTNIQIEKGPWIHGKKNKDSKSFQSQRKNFTYKKIILTDFSRALDARIEFLWESNFESRIAYSACGTNMGHKRHKGTQRKLQIYKDWKFNSYATFCGEKNV